MAWPRGTLAVEPSSRGKFSRVKRNGSTLGVGWALGTAVGSTLGAGVGVASDSLGVQAVRAKTIARERVRERSFFTENTSFLEYFGLSILSVTQKKRKCVTERLQSLKVF